MRGSCRVPAEEKIKEDEIEMLIRNGIVEECNSEWSSNLVVVRKKDGTPRTCVDLRRVNMATRFDCFPLARIDESLDALGGAKYMSTLDNSSAFWSILLHPEDRDKTAFGTRSHGQLRFKRMPFGLTNATATYARALTFVLRGLLWKRCVAYCDDTVLWGSTFDDHMESLHAVLKRYAIHNVNIKISKCHFACARTEFVGHQVEVGSGVKVCEKKIKAIVEMKRPSNVQELKSFIGMCSYYKRFIKDFAHIAMPLRRIENVFKSKLQSIAFLWRDNQEKAFNALKAALATAPVLAFPDFSKPMIVISDCSDTAKGAVLCQNIDGIERPIMYLSQALNEHELRYGITDKEGCAATWAMRRMRPWIVSNQVILITDHSSLVALTNGKGLKNMRQQRYAMDLSEFALTIKHRAGALLHTADALSRCGYTKKHADSMVEQLRNYQLPKGPQHPFA